MLVYLSLFNFFFSRRRRHTRCALVTGVQTCALPISDRPHDVDARADRAVVVRRPADEREGRDGAEADDAATAIDDLVRRDAAEPDPVLDPLLDPRQFDAGHAIVGTRSVANGSRRYGHRRLRWEDSRRGEGGARRVRTRW